MLIQQVGVQVVNFTVQLFLARLLLPEAFGLIALIQIFLAIGQALMDGGMTSSLIRTKEPNQADYSTVFFINLVSSFLIYCLLFLAAPYISLFFRLPELTLIIRVYSLSFIIQALVGVQTTKLTKEMNFKLQMYMQIPSTILGGLVGLWMAFHNYGVWSLVWMYLASSLVFMIQHWYRTDWRPSLIFDKQKLRYHFNFGYKLTLSSLLTSLYNNLYVVIIGKLFPISQLGFYNQANTLRMFPVQNLTMALQKVTYPVFSSLQDDDEAMKSVFRRITLIVFFVISPVMLFLLLAAEPLFRLLLTEKWLPAVPYFQILSISAIVYPISIYNLNILLAKGQSGLHFKLEAIKKAGSSIFLLLIIPFGIYGVIYAAAISMLIHAFVNTYFSGRLINYPLKEQIRNLLPILTISCATTLATYLGCEILRYTFNGLNDVILIALVFVFFFGTYLIISYLFRIKSLTEIKEIALQFWGRLRAKK